LDNFSKGQNQFFIIGSQRSGTTLLELILDSHKNICTVGEPSVYNFSRSLNPLSGKIIGYKVPSLTYKYDYFKENYPNSKYLFIFRNVKSVVASMLNFKMQLENKSLAEVNWSRETEDSIDSISCILTRRKLRDEYNRVKNLDLILQTTLSVFCKYYLFDEYKNLNLDIKEVKYSDIVINTRETIEDILVFLSLEWDDNVLNHHLLHKGKFSGEIDPKRSIDSSSLYLWKDKFTQDEINKIDNYLIYLKNII